MERKLEILQQQQKTNLNQETSMYPSTAAENATSSTCSSNPSIIAQKEEIVEKNSQSATTFTNRRSKSAATSTNDESVKPSNLELRFLKESSSDDEYSYTSKSSGDDLSSDEGSHQDSAKLRTKRVRRNNSVQSSGEESNEYTAANRRAKRARRNDTVQSSDEVSNEYTAGSKKMRARRNDTVQSSDDSVQSLIWGQESNEYLKRARRNDTVQSSDEVSNEYTAGSKKMRARRNDIFQSSDEGSSKYSVNGETKRAQRFSTVQSSDEEVSSSDDDAVAPKGKLMNVRIESYSEDTAAKHSTAGQDDSKAIFLDDSSDEEVGKSATKPAWKAHNLVVWKPRREREVEHTHPASTDNHDERRSFNNAQFTSSSRTIKEPLRYGSLADNDEVDKALSDPSNTLSWKPAQSTSSSRTIKEPLRYGSLADDDAVDKALSDPSNILSWKPATSNRKREVDQSEKSDESEESSSSSSLQILDQSELSDDESSDDSDEDSDYDSGSADLLL